jgi:hypothetical protein
VDRRLTGLEPPVYDRGVSTTAGAGAATTGARPTSSLFSSLAGLTSLLILLQALWAGLFVPTGKGGPYQDTWVEVHQWGGLIALVLGVATAVVGFVTLRPRRDLWVAAIALAVLLLVEVGLGSAISEGDSRGAAAVHIPLALVLMSLTVWLPLRARR